jgi:hypothetical protein
MMSVTLCALTAPLDCLLFVIVYLLPLFSLTISDDMYYHLLTLGSAIAASALPQHATPGCREVNITVTVTAPRFILNTTVNDNWDAAALTLNLTSRDRPNCWHNCASDEHLDNRSDAMWDRGHDASTNSRYYRV